MKPVSTIVTSAVVLVCTVFCFWVMVQLLDADRAGVTVHLWLWDVAPKSELSLKFLVFSVLGVLFGIGAMFYIGLCIFISPKQEV